MEQRAELAGMKLGEVRKRARAAGVDAEAIDAAIDEADDPKAAMAELIVSTSASLEELPDAKDEGSAAAAREKPTWIRSFQSPECMLCEAEWGFRGTQAARQHCR